MADTYSPRSITTLVTAWERVRLLKGNKQAGKTSAYLCACAHPLGFQTSRVAMSLLVATTDKLLGGWLPLRHLWCVVFRRFLSSKTRAAITRGDKVPAEEWMSKGRELDVINPDGFRNRVLPSAQDGLK